MTNFSKTTILKILCRGKTPFFFCLTEKKYLCTIITETQNVRGWKGPLWVI